ncbi:MAG: hypothetical protein AAF997_15720, partial [Myxococcota bacterium]
APVISDVPQAEQVSPLPDVEATDPNAPTPYATDAQRAYLRSWLEYAANVEKRQRRSAGVNGVIGGSLFMAIGLSLYLSSSSSLDDFDKGIGLALIGASSLYLSVGIFRLAKKSDGERRLDRWYVADNGQMTAREFGRFEGELRAQAEAAERAVRLQRWGNFGLFMGGALMLGLTPVSNLQDKETGYIVGGVTAGVGLLGFAFSFMGSPQANYWKAYQAGLPPPQARRWSVAPAAGRTYAGAQLRATF